MFSDVVGSTALAERIGDTRWDELLTAHEITARSLAAAHSGRVVKGLGGGFMFAFEDPAAAVRCGVELQRAAAAGDARLRIRVGVHVGEAVERDSDFFGRNVAVAPTRSASASASTPRRLRWRARGRWSA